MKNSLLALALAGSAMAYAGTAAAQTAPEPIGQGTLIVTGRVTSVSSSADDPILTSGGAATGLHVDVGESVMPTLGFTYFVSDHWAVEAILGATQHEIRAQGPGTDVAVHETWVLPPVVTLQYRPTPNAQVSPYVGAGVNAMIFFSGDDMNGFTVDLDNGVGLALQAGADVQLTGPWSLNFDVKKVWFDTDATINGGALQSDVSLDPWVVSIGLARRF
ncbi:OmpW family outer membrane protein [Brevundimonas sp.]|uniref:OmpW/AlkL family protein n=1 Tax=Brevundimonas sp. TaxID=1871086 RepID=UPI0025E7A715|nr:OmpW family outer membrane protein [Brevundimonas sp.]